ncbi:hypothetical protein TNCV_4976461 [Trichonephila clavipes]|nr:hypothetical protein TNCV_4976461 [Trichonephila clavipes]
MFQCNQQKAYSPRTISQWRSFHSYNQSEIFSYFENRRNRSCNLASFPHPLNQSGDSHPPRPNHITGPTLLSRYGMKERFVLYLPVTAETHYHLTTKHSFLLRNVAKLIVPLRVFDPLP